MSESPQPPSREGAFGAPPGASPWAQPTGQPAYAGHVPAPTTPFPVSTFVLLIVSVISLIATGIIGIPSAVVAVLAWRRNATDAAACRQRTTTGWVAYAVNFVVALPLLIWFYVWALGNQ